MSDKKFQNGGRIILEEAGKTISEASKVSKIFNGFFVSVASEIGFDEDVVSTTDAINEYNIHPSIEKIKQSYENEIRDFDFQTVDAGTVMLMITNIDSKIATGYDNIPEKLIKVAHQELATPPFAIW